MRIFITGGTGFLGRALLRYWTEGDNQNYPEFACILTRNPQKFLVKYPEFNNISWLSFHAGDIFYPQTFPDNKRFTHILHAATETTIGPQLSPLEWYCQIAEGTKNLLEYAVMNKIQRFLLTSSGGVYGPQPKFLEKIPETYCGELDTMNVHNAYSIGKRSAEHLCALYRDRYRIDFVIARCFAHVGRDLPTDTHFAIGNFIRDALCKENIMVKGDGSPIRTYMDQLDLAIWLNKLLEYGEPGEVYNVGSDIPISILDLAHLVRDVLAPSRKIVVENYTKLPDLRNRYVPSIEKAKNKLGLFTTVSLEESIESTAKWFLQRTKK
jgi:UDP-glucuronate decarboxylase